MRVPTVNPDKKVTGLEKYEKLQYIDGGATGLINLVRSKEDGELYALKEINMTFLSAKDK